MFDAIYELFLQGYSLDDIALKLNVTLDTVVSQLYSAGNVMTGLKSAWKTWFDVNDIDYRISSEGFFLPSVKCYAKVVTSDMYGKGIIQNMALSARSKARPVVFLYEFDLFDSRFLEALKQRLQSRYHNKYPIGARKCKVFRVDRKCANEFLDKYHFQGGLNNLGTTFGLYYKDELVSMIAINKSRFGDYHYELSRYCFNPKYSISGGFDKLLTCCREDLLSEGDILVSYMDLDRRFSADEVYAKSGFIEVGITSPSYGWWSHDAQRYLSRYETTKKRLIEQGFPESATETEIMSACGFTQVYRAGSVKYEKVFK